MVVPASDAPKEKKPLDQSTESGKEKVQQAEGIKACGGEPGKLDQKGNVPCPSFYGVRSYLHHFYEKNPTLYEHDESAEYAYLLRPRRHNSRLCRPIFWKATVWIGINFLVFGIIGIFVAYLVPKKRVYVETTDGHYFIVSQAAETYNNNMEIVKLIGLLLFCFGGAVTIIGLLLPTFLWQYCEESGARSDEEEFKIRVTSIGQEQHQPGTTGPSSTTPLNLMSPVSGVTTVQDSVQPERKPNESVVTKAGMKEMKQ